MDKLKKTNIEQGAQKCPSVSTNNCPDNGPFFNPDYFGHVVVQTIEELNSIPCKLRQDGMVASIVQDEYSEWQLQSSKTGFGVCDNRAWVKVVKGDSQYDGGNLFLFDTEADANNYIDTTLDAKQGQMFYIAELDNYYKFDGQDGYTAIVEDGDFVPLNGTEEGKPVTGTLEFQKSDTPFITVKDSETKSFDMSYDNSDAFSIIHKHGDRELATYISEDGLISAQIVGGEIKSNFILNEEITLLSTTRLLVRGYILGYSDYSNTDPTNKQIYAQRSYVDNNRQFVKNGVGWSLKYRADNPSFYGDIGQEAVDFSISKSVNTKMPERFSYGANGFNTAVFGIYNSAMDAGSLVSGVQNRSQGQCNNIMSSNSTIIQDKGTGNFTKKDNGIYSGSNNTIENNRYSTIIGGVNNKMVGKISPVNGKYDMCNAILGGNSNTVTYGFSNTILGGDLNQIIGEENAREGDTYNSRNAIIAGYNNKIITATGTNRQAYSSVIFGGEGNIAQGHYNMIAGYGNHAVTIGEVLVGIHGTIQNTSLSGFDFIGDSRMFNVGVGSSNTQGVVTRKDGLSVFRNGLVTAPQLTTSLIDTNPRSLVTKEFVDNKVSNFPLPTNWTNASQRFSGLVDKSDDATFNQVAVFDAHGNLAKASLTSSEAVKTVNGIGPDEDGNIDVTIAESQIIKDDKENLITEYVRDNPNLFEISGQHNIILSTHTNNPISVTGGNNFLQGGGHSILDWYSAAFGQDHSILGSYCAAFGFKNTINESYSVAFGGNNIVRGGYSSAFGYRNTINAGASSAFGIGNTIGGSDSFAFGSYNIVNSSNSSAFGSYNKVYSQIDIPTEICFSIGIGYAGPGGEDRMNALSVFKNGEAWFDELTVDKIENSKSNKVVVTKEYLDLRVPTPPETGTHVLKSVNGVVSWVAE